MKKQPTRDYFLTSDKTIVTGTLLDDAREYAAEQNFRLASDIIQQVIPFGEHVAAEEKQALYESQLQTGNDIVSGKLCYDRTVIIRVNYFLTDRHVQLYSIGKKQKVVLHDSPENKQSTFIGNVIAPIYLG